MSGENWIGAITALIALFGLSGVAVGEDSLDGLPGEGKAVAVAALIVALLAAVRAVLRSHRAAYGWPTPVDVGDDHELRTWHESRRPRFREAANDLKEGVTAACATVAALAVAVGVIWLWPRDTPTPQVEITRDDDNITCGDLLATTTDGSLRIRGGGGEVTTIEVSDVRSLNPTKKCDS